MTRRLVDADAFMHQLLTFPFYPSSFGSFDKKLDRTDISNAFMEYNDYLASALHNAVVSDEEYIIVRVEKPDQDK